MKLLILSTRYTVLILFLNSCFLFTAQAQEQEFLYGDLLPDAPELSTRGSYAVGVKTIDLINPNQIDILNSKNGKDSKYDRPITIEMWYPSSSNEKMNTTVYDEVMGTANDSLRPLIPFKFKGRAKRDAKPATSEGNFPLVIVSHGYVGSRYLMTYLTENLASKGYVVVAIDHTDSTFRDANAFQSTLLNRPKDVRFVLDEMENLNLENFGNDFKNFINTQNTALIGYSMGGYGVLNVGGAGYSDVLAGFFKKMTGGSMAISIHLANNPIYQQKRDKRIKAIVAFAPWGMERGVWDSQGLKGLKTPTFFIAGSQDDIAGYEKGIKAIYEGSINADRYLLTYKNARHNVAPNPPPAESLSPGLHIDEYYRYAEPSWDQRRLNNINQHFVTAFLGIHLKQKKYFKFLDLQQNSNVKDWTGFKPRSSTGMELLHDKPTN